MERDKNTALHDRLRQRSPWLDGQNNPGMNWIPPDRQNAAFQLLQIEGNEKGQYFKSGDWHTSQLTFVRMKITEIESDFKRMQQQARNMGKDPITVMPYEMQEKYDSYLANLDILLEEAIEIKRQIKEYDERIQTEDSSHLLEYGLKLSGRFHGSRATPEMRDVIAMMDGQRVDQFPDGTLVIANGPYKGMDLPSYRKLAAKWQQDRRIADAEKLARLQEEARETNKPIPNILSFTSKKVDPKNLPKWPQGVVNHYEKK